MKENPRLAAALDLLRKGIPVVAGDPELNQPYVQELDRVLTVLPTEAQVRGWWQEWPDAAVYVVNRTPDGQPRAMRIAVGEPQEPAPLTDEERALLQSIDEGIREICGLEQEEAMALLRGAIVALADGCDGAASRDGAGFNKRDAEAGHALADKVRRGEPFTEDETRVALRFVRRYRGQLEAAGIDAARILGQGGGEREGKESQATRLVAIGREAELWHSPDAEAYATVVVGDHREHWPVRSKAFRQWLARRFYESEGKAPGGQAVQDALNVLEGDALFAGPEYQVFVRVAAFDGKVYVDLADARWRAVEVNPEGWCLLENPLARFRQARGMLPLPEPAKGGSLELLRKYVNVADDEAFTLLAGWLIGALHPCGPYPVLVLQGEQGSAKSTTARLLRSLVDPNVAALRTLPREERDLAISARNGWIVALDNLSGVSDWLSDAICRLASGGGFATRELYTDADEMLFDAKRPVILNGIDDLAARPDLRDRAIILTLPVIDDAARREESVLLAEFERDRPLILGALYDAVSCALRNVDRVRLARRPRMADFARWVVAAESALPWPAGAFLDAYCANRQAAAEAGVQDNLLAQAIIELLSAAGEWTGTASELLDRLAGRVDERTLKSRGWPQTPRALGNALRRLAPDLRRAAGLDVEFVREGHERKRTIIVRKREENIVRTVRNVRGETKDLLDGISDADASADDDRRNDSLASAHRPHKTPATDHEDDADDGMRHFSNSDELEEEGWL